MWKFDLAGNTWTQVKTKEEIREIAKKYNRKAEKFNFTAFMRN